MRATEPAAGEAYALDQAGILMAVATPAVGAVAAGFGMGRYAGQVTGVLRPPENITAQELRWDTSSADERHKIDQWVKVGGYRLILWWAIIGGLIMTYLYSVAGLAYLHEDFLKTGKIPSGVAVPLQMATIAQGVMGPMAGWLMLIFIMVTLYDAQFPFYDRRTERSRSAPAPLGRLRAPDWEAWGPARALTVQPNSRPVPRSARCRPLMTTRSRDPPTRVATTES